MEHAIGIVVAVFASSGFWQLILYKVQKKDKKKTASERALMYLLRQDLVARCDYWLEQDHIPISEWSDLVKENEIYHELGGDGDLKERMEALEEKPKTAK